jgi:hypothetical protein
VSDWKSYKRSICFFLYFFFYLFLFLLLHVVVFLNPYVEIYVPRSRVQAARERVCKRCYVCIRIIPILFRVRGPELEPPPPPESYYIACDMDVTVCEPGQTIPRLILTSGSAVCMIYGLPARESRTDGRLHFHFFFYLLPIKIRVYIILCTYNIWYYKILSAWVYKVLYNVIISAARANVVVLKKLYLLYIYIYIYISAARDVC